MRTFYLPWALAFGLAACATGPAPMAPSPAAYDPEADVARFLETRDPAEEDAVLDKLRQKHVSSETVRALLKRRPAAREGQAGTFFNLPLDSQGKQYPYSLRAPAMEPEQTYPLVLVLHGAGGSGQSTLPRWIRRLPDHYLIACPSYPAGAWWARRAENLVLDLIRHVRSQYPVDPNRVFLAGLSNGAVGAYLTAMFNPDYFAGVIPIAGTITERYMHFLVNLIHTPLYSIQGRYDPIFPIRYSQRIKKIMADLKYPAVFREHEQQTSAHGGHFLPEGEVPALAAWMERQRRVVNPAKVRMVREANHLGPIQWARVSRGYQLAALQIPGPEPEPVNVKDGKIATLIAERLENNEFEIQGKNLLEHELYLNSDLIDYSRPVLVTYQDIREEEGKWITGSRRVVFQGKVEPDLEVMLRGYKERRDPDLLFETILRIPVEDKVQVASRP